MAILTPLTLKPRLKSSKKWTQLPQELLTQIVSVCRENFTAQAKAGEFLAKGQIYSEEILFQLGYLPKDRLRQVNFNVSIQFDPKKENALKLIHLALDCAGSLMADHFEKDEPYAPTEWEKVTIEGTAVYHCLTTENSKLEEEADKWLGKLSDELVGEEPDELDDLPVDLDDDESPQDTAKSSTKKPPTKTKKGPKGSSDPLH